MESNMDKSLSETDVSLVGKSFSTPPNYVSFRAGKRGRDDMEDSISQQLKDFKEEIKKMMSFYSEKHGNEIQNINSTLKEIQQSNSNIQSSIAYLTAQNDDLTKKICKLENKALEDKKHIASLENKIEDLQMGGRKSNFVVKNVPRKSHETKEDLLDMIMCLSQNLSCSINKYDIKDIYRVRGKNPEQQNSPIIVETASTILKSEILRMGKVYNLKNHTKLCCKHLGFKSQEDTLIFLSEHLTPKGSRLHFLARDLTKSGAYKFCWTAYGKVYVKKDEQAKSIVISSEEQIHQLLGKA